MIFDGRLVRLAPSSTALIPFDFNGDCGPYSEPFTLLAVLAVSIAGDSATVRAVAQAVLGTAAGVVTSLWAMRFARWHGRLLRFGSATAIMPLAFVLFVWFDGQLLDGAMEMPLFVPMAWLVVHAWRRMQASGRTMVSAGADIVFAVLLDVLTVLFPLWLANLLHLPEVEVKALRAAAWHLGGLIDLQWSQWASADAVLVAVFLTAALRRGRRTRITAAADRLRLSGALGALRRTVSVAKTVLESAVFLGSAGAPAVGPVLSQALQERYTADLQRDLSPAGRPRSSRGLSSSSPAPTSAARPRATDGPGPRQRWQIRRGGPSDPGGRTGLLDRAVTGPDSPPVRSAGRGAHAGRGRAGDSGRR